MNSGSVQAGFAYEVKEHSEKVHRLPAPPNAFGEKRYELIYREILKLFNIAEDDQFTKTDDRRPCAFVLKREIDMVKSILDQISEQKWQEQFDIFELELLFNELKNCNELDSDKLRVTVTNSFIEQDKYDATADISCDFHEKEDVTRHCALSYVRRWYFLFCDHICEKIGVKLVPGKHLPANADTSAVKPFSDDEDDDDGLNRPQCKRNRWTDESKSSSNSYHGNASVCSGYVKLEESESITDSDTESDSSDD